VSLEVERFPKGERHLLREGSTCIPSRKKEGHAYPTGSAGGRSRLTCREKEACKGQWPTFWKKKSPHAKVEGPPEMHDVEKDAAEPKGRAWFGDRERFLPGRGFRRRARPTRTGRKEDGSETAHRLNPVVGAAVWGGQGEGT